MVAIYKIIAPSIPTICREKGFLLIVQQDLFEFSKKEMGSLSHILLSKDSSLKVEASVKYS